MGHGRLPDTISGQVRAAASKVSIVTSPEAFLGDLAVLLAVTAIATANCWADFTATIDEAFDQLFQTDESGEQITTLLFEIAFNRARMEENPDDRIEVFASFLEKTRSRSETADPAVLIADRFADAMSGTHAQPFINLVARARS